MELKGAIAGSRWPTATDYSHVVQAPGQAFQHAALAGMEPVYGMLGMPMSASGQNATVYLLQDPAGTSFALRCFTKPSMDSQPRYEALERFAAAGDRPWLASARWLSNAVRVNGQSWPVILMPWVPGRPLNVEVADSVGDAHRLDQMVAAWEKVVEAIEPADFAHGDLQHGNVLVTDDVEMCLVDLDGVWLPGAGLTPPSEFGHPNYQHRDRAPHHWGPHIDSFSALVIDVGLRALRADASLMKYAGGESIVLARADLMLPQSSAAFADLLNSPDPEVVARAQRLRQLCESPIEASFVPYASLLAADRTVMRPPAAAAPPGPVAATSTGPALATSGDWWNPSPAAPMAAMTSQPAASVPTWQTGAPRAAQVPSAVARPVATHAAPGTDARGGGVGVSSLNGGLLGGFVFGLLAVLLYSVFRDSVSTDIEAALFVGLVGPLVGFGAMSTQPFLVGRVRQGFVQGGVGALVGLVASAVGLAIADPLFDALVDRRDATQGQVVVACAIVWFIVAVLIGSGLGALVSGRGALYGAGMGAVAGGVGGALFGTAANAERGGLIIDGSDPLVVGVTAVVAGAIGAAVGAARRVGATGLVRVIEGPSTGLEVVVKKKLTVGSGSTAGLRVQHPMVHPQHCTIVFGDHGAEISANAPIDVNGVSLASGTVAVANGAVIRVGPIFVRVSMRQGVPS